MSTIGEQCHEIKRLGGTKAVGVNEEVRPLVLVISEPKGSGALDVLEEMLKLRVVLGTRIRSKTAESRDSEENVRASYAGKI